MVEKKKRFEACLLRDSAGELFVVEWHQLVTTADKSKLTVGSSVGYKKSTNKREKIIRGIIVVIGSLQLCKQQMNLIKTKINKKKVQTNESNNDNEEEEANILDDKDSSDSDNEGSCQSADDCLHLDAEEETSDDHSSKAAEGEHLKIIDKKNKSQTKTSTKSSSNIEDNQEQTASSPTGKRVGSDIDTELPPPKRSTSGFVRQEELKVQNIRLQNQIKMYQNEWMPRPTDAGVIRFFVRMGELLSFNGADKEVKSRKLENLCRFFNMDEHQLTNLQKGNGTKTARALVRAYYPSDTRAGVSSSDVDSELRQAVHDYVNLFHGMEGLTAGTINESINNVFRSATKQKKEKLETTQPASSINKNSKTINKKKIINNDKENVYSMKQ